MMQTISVAGIAARIMPALLRGESSAESSRGFPASKA
jgi:hypothetical protein